MPDQNEYVKEFLVESKEGLDRLDQALVALEENPADAQRLDGIFRTLHTIKGNSGFLGFPLFGELTHAGESLLGRLRSGELSLNTEITDALLQLVDAGREILKEIERSGNEGSDKQQELRVVLFRLASPDEGHGKGKPKRKTERLEQTVSLQKAGTEDEDIVVRAPGKSSQPPDDRRIEATSEFKSSVVQGSVGKQPAVTEAASTSRAADSDSFTSELLRPNDSIERRSKRDSSRLGAPSSIIRVDVSLLDQLMNLVGELVLARNRIVQLTSQHDLRVLADPTEQLNQLTSDLQAGIMKTRMQPISNVWDKYPRLVRDLARHCNKNVRLDMHGTETELDKTLLEALANPLVHLVRNAIDHGIEKPETRKASGKPEKGTLSLHAYHQGGHVNIEIADDGAGLNTEIIRSKAVQRGLVTAERAAGMSDHDVHQFIFAPGFSTVDEITNVSGRGVGMDVVRTDIEEIGGTVNIESYPQQGTNIRISVPLTLAIVPAMVVRNGGQRFALPQVNIIELLSLEADQVGQHIEQFHNTPVLRLRGELLPLGWLNDLFRTTGEEPARSDPDGDNETNILVLQTGSRRFGLVVDGVSSMEEIVVKPIGVVLRGIAAYAGATIMGDGQVALILDVLGIARSMGLLTHKPIAHVQRDNAEQCEQQPAAHLLVCAVGQRRIGIALPQVARLEEVAASAVERSGKGEVAMSPSGLLPLVRLRSVLGEEDDSSQPKNLRVVVHTEARGNVGFVVDRVLDIIDEPIEVVRSATEVAIEGVAEVRGHVTDLLSLPILLRTASPPFFGQTGEGPSVQHELEIRSTE